MTATSGVTRELSQREQNVAEKGPRATNQHSEKKFRNDSESGCRGCLYWLKERKFPEKCN